MTNTLLARIRDHATSASGVLPFAPATEQQVEATEKALGFAIPPLLRACYLHVGNGGFGPGYGLIGLGGGYASDHGHLIETYRLFQESEAAEGGTWRDGLLPFCGWGCNIFSCVACLDSEPRISLYEEGEVWPQDYDLTGFFAMWLEGVDLLLQGTFQVEEIEIINPFTKKRTKIQRRKRQ
jgi:hypothetical protein